MEPLPNSWAEIQPDTIYQTTNGLLVSFSQAQIQLGIISNPVTSELFISLISLCVLCVLVRLNHSDAAGNDIKYDQNNKHLKAIEKGIVATRGNIGLVPSEIEDYELKSKVLGKGGDRRFHAIIIDRVLHFPGFVTEH